MMRKVTEPCVNIGHFQILPETCRIQCGSRVIHIEQKAMDVLMMLASNPEEVVSRAEILDAIWPASPSGDQALNRAISHLRKALDDCPDSPSIIETVPGRGYRLIAECQPSSATLHLQSAERIPLRLRRRSRVAFGLAGGITVITAAALALLAFKPFVTPVENAQTIRILQGPVSIVYVGPTIVPANRRDLQELAQQITQTFHAALERNDYVIVTTQELFANETSSISEWANLAVDIGIPRLTGAEVIPIESRFSVRLYIFNTINGDLVWYRTIDVDGQGSAHSLLTEIEAALLEAAPIFLETPKLPVSPEDGETRLQSLPLPTP